MKNTILRTIRMACIPLALTACGPTTRQPSPAEPAFDLREIQALAAPVRTGSPPVAGAPALRKEAPELARTYAEMLYRFDSIYGDGVGPAKRGPSYIACKQAFQAVRQRVEAVPVAMPDADLDVIWRSLASCRQFADRWSRATEMATFGEDLKTLTYGAMLVLSYTASATGSALGPRFFAEASEAGASANSNEAGSQPADQRGHSPDGGRGSQ